jgi:hypothetical protein
MTRLIPEEPRMASCRPVGPFDRLAIDVRQCDLVEISVGLFAEFEQAGLRPETWPAAARVAAERETASWQARNPDRVIRLVSYGATAGACYVALHHAKKTGG